MEVWKCMWKYGTHGSMELSSILINIQMCKKTCFNVCIETEEIQIDIF